MTTHLPESAQSPLFSDIDTQLEKLKVKAEARQNIHTFITNDDWEQALKTAADEEINLYEGDDPKLADAAIKYWRSLQKQAAEAITVAWKTLEDLQTVTANLNSANDKLKRTLDDIDNDEQVLQSLNANIDLTALHKAWITGNVKEFPQLIQTKAGELKDIKDLNQRILFQALLFRWQMRFDHYLVLKGLNDEADRILRPNDLAEYEECWQWLQRLRTLTPILIPEAFYFSKGKLGEHIKTEAHGVVNRIKILIEDNHYQEWDNYFTELRSSIETRMKLGEALLEVESTEMSQSNAKATLRERSSANLSSNESAANKGNGDFQ